MAATSDDMMSDMVSDIVLSDITFRDCVEIYVWCDIILQRLLVSLSSGRGISSGG